MLAPLRSPFGIVRLSRGNRIAGFEEKPLLPYWVNAGVYALEREFFAMLPDVGDHETTVFPELASQGRLFGFRSDAYWKPIDTVKDVTEAAAHLGRGGAAGSLRRCREGKRMFFLPARPPSCVLQEYQRGHPSETPARGEDPSGLPQNGGELSAHGGRLPRREEDVFLPTRPPSRFVGEWGHSPQSPQSKGASPPLHSPRTGHWEDDTGDGRVAMPGGQDSADDSRRE